MAKEKKVGVSKIVVQLGDKETALTVEQAKELRDALNAVLGERVEKIVERDHWYPYYPYITYGTVCVNGTVEAKTVGGTSITWGSSGDYKITLGDNVSA
jgi:hypothetical protein